MYLFTLLPLNLPRHSFTLLPGKYKSFTLLPGKYKNFTLLPGKYKSFTLLPEKTKSFTLSLESIKALHCCLKWIKAQHCCLESIEVLHCCLKRLKALHFCLKSKSFTFLPGKYKMWSCKIKRLETWGSQLLHHHHGSYNIMYLNSSGVGIDVKLPLSHYLGIFWHF